MKFEYQGQKYELIDPDLWSTLEAAQLQEASGGHTPAEITVDAKNLGPLGLHGLVWISLRRAGVDVEWNALDIPYYQTLKTMEGLVLEAAAVDPSTASTPQRAAARGGRGGSRARSVKK